MNIMAQAHKATKEFFQRVPSSKMSYRAILKENLITAHKEFKTMQEANPFVKMIKDCETRIAQLEAIEHRDGYIVIIGDKIRLPVKENSNGWTRVENASIFWYEEDARALAVRVRNGNNEVGQVVKKNDQINWEISEQKQLLKSMQEHLNKA